MRIARPPDSNATSFYRQFTAQTGDTLYFSTLFQTATADGGTDEDFLSFGFNNQAGETTAGFVHRLNSSGTDHYFAIRISQSSEARLSLGTTTNRTYFLVFRLRKTTPGAGNNYNELALFVDPSTANEPAPTVVTNNSRWTSAAFLACRAALTETNDVYYLDQFRVGTTYADVALPLDQLPETMPPVFTPAGGTFTNRIDVSISCASTGATIRYTTDGTLPSTNNGAVYAAPITLARPTLLQAIAQAPGKTESSIAGARFGIENDIVAADSFEDYPAGPLAGRGGGEGFLAPYAALTSATVVSRSMVYAGGTLTVKGGARALRVDGNTGTRHMGREFYPQSGRRLYLSFLFEHAQSFSDDDFFCLGLQTNPDVQPEAGVQHRVNTNGTALGFGIRYGGGSGSKAPFDTVSGRVYFAVLRLEKSVPGPASTYDRANASKLRLHNRRLPNHEVRIMKERDDGPEKAGMTSMFCGSLFGNLRLDGVPGAK